MLVLKLFSNRAHEITVIKSWRAACTAVGRTGLYWTVPLDFDPSQILSPNWFEKPGTLHSLFRSVTSSVLFSLESHALFLPAAPCFGVGYVRHGEGEVQKNQVMPGCVVGWKY
ncbi:unnamed protein product [Ectocarpus fasciculatus]